MERKGSCICSLQEEEDMGMKHRKEPKKFGSVQIITCTIICFCILSLLKTLYYPNDYVYIGKTHLDLKLQIPTSEEILEGTSKLGQTHLDMKLQIPRTEEILEGASILDDLSSQEPIQEDEAEEEVIATTDTVNLICYESGTRSDTCEARGDVRVQGSSNTIFVNPSSTPREWKIKPYTRKGNPGALSNVKEWSLKPFPDTKPPPQCTKNHTATAVIFSLGGFSGNYFHDFTDILIPLFITSHRFKGEVHFLVSDTKPWWLSKYDMILRQLSKYDIIDTETRDDNVHCFRKAIVGPTFHKELGINATKSPDHTMSEFKQVMRKAYGLERATVTISVRPRLLIVSRKKSRAFLNEKEITAMATDLGFDVIVGESGFRVTEFAKLVNSADVMIGVHGAGLTNMVFLPSGAVMIQVVPYGGLERVTRQCFKDPAEDMGVKYLEYVIGEEESSLIEEYKRSDPVIRDPDSVHRKGWAALSEVYLDKQNVRPNLVELRNTLLEAMKSLPAS